MKHVKTYEGWFDFLKNKKVSDPVPELSVKSHCDNVTEEIVDSMWDIFDEYDIQDCTTLTKWQGSNPSGWGWKYNNTKLNDGTSVNCGIVIRRNRIDNDDRYFKLLMDIFKVIPVINGRTGVVLNKPYDGRDGLVIDFPMYISSNIRRRGW